VRVALDMHHVRQSDAGTARYARGLAGALRARGDIDVREIGGGPRVRPGLRQKLLTAEQDFYWYPFQGRKEAASLDADVYHCPAVRAPITRGKPPLVVTVHDLVALRFPETMPRWTRFYSRVTLDRMLASADLIITPSADTANDLEQMTDADPNCIRVIWNGIDEVFYEETTGAPASAEPYILFVGTPEPRKNLQRLVNAVGDLRNRGLRYKLVVAGGGGWGSVNIAGAHVEHVGRQRDEDLRRLYAGAACVAQVSLHEGFGLPVGEAMAAGAPVVISREGALPEIAGNAAVVVDAYDERSIADGLERAIADRDSLIALGRNRAELFRWRECAAKHFDAYRSVL
jgi:glycosyltransferase involved in cell wall biosynthesis